MINESFIEKMKKTLPEMISPKELTKSGIGLTGSNLSLYRKKKIGIPFIRLGKQRIRYLKEDVIKYLEDNYYETKNN